MDLSIIITYYSGISIINKCLNCLTATIDEINLHSEIIIVNDNPNENLEQLLIDYPNIIVINHENNLGHPAACNTGAIHSHGDILIFMDCDIFVTDGWLINLISLYNSFNNIGAISSTILDSSTGKIHSVGVEIHKVDILKILRGNTTALLEEDYIESDFLTSACLLIPKSIFENTNGFDTTFFNSDGDLDLTHRIKSSGYRLLTACKSHVYHKGRVAGEMRNLSVNDTKALFFRKWGCSLPDGIDIIKKLFNNFSKNNSYSKEYVIINLNKTLFLEDYLSCIKEGLNISILQVLNYKKYNNSTGVDLIEFLNMNIIGYNTPLLFFSDNYKCIKPNYFWIKERSDQLDITLDYFGNIDFIYRIF